MRDRLSREDAETVVLATALLPLLTLGVHLVGFRLCHRLVTIALGRPARSLPPGLAVSRGRRFAAMVDLAAARTSLLLADCLPRALTLWWVCRRQRLDAAFRLGVRTITGRFEAHAWVEVCGVPVGEEEDVRRIYDAFDLEGAERGGAPA